MLVPVPSPVGHCTAALLLCCRCIGRPVNGRRHISTSNFRTTAVMAFWCRPLRGCGCKSLDNKLLAHTNPKPLPAGDCVDRTSLKDETPLFPCPWELRSGMGARLREEQMPLFCALESFRPPCPFFETFSRLVLHWSRCLGNGSAHAGALSGELNTAFFHETSHVPGQ